MNAPLIKSKHKLNISETQKKYGEFIGYDFKCSIIDTMDDFKTIVKNLLEQFEKNLIAISTLSGRGKSTFVNNLTEKQIILSPKEQVIVKHIIGKQIEKKGYTHSDISVFHAEADWFLGLIGKERYTIMMETYKNFLKYYGDEKLATQTIIKFLTENNDFTVNGIYGRTDIERTEQKKLTKLEFTGTPDINKRLTILDGTNSLILGDQIKETSNLTGINVSKILLDPCPETAFMGLFNRDVLEYKRNLDFFTYFRPKETAYIMKGIIKPALQDKEVILFDNYERYKFDFEQKNLIQLINSLNKSKKILLKEKGEDETKAFIEFYTNNLIELFRKKLEE